ncbi:MAG TPA: hypothetical protein VMV49_14300 [Candidatus Deferrimicrobium sp.]|nr:hypothetical protein [Candidatus Deferrimicrobium sp.]
MTPDSKDFTINLSIRSDIFKNDVSEYEAILESGSGNFFSHLFIENDGIFQKLKLKNQLKLISVCSMLKNNLRSSEYPEVSQINHLGNSISPYICPNNPKLDGLIEKEFESFIKSPYIAGIQMNELEMPFLPASLGCFCQHCFVHAEEYGIKLDKISQDLRHLDLNRLNENWFLKNYPEWIKFKTNTITQFAGRMMILIRKLNPNITLGLNVNFYEKPELYSYNYFFLALYLDNLNFIINHSSNLVEKRVLNNIKAVTKKFLGEIQVFIQMKVPDKFNLQKVRAAIETIKKHKFNSVIFHVRNLQDFKNINTI